MTNSSQPHCDATLIDALISGEISDVQQSRLSEHLDGCPRCRAEIDTQSMGTVEETSQLLKVERFDAESSFDISPTAKKRDAVLDASEFPIAMQGVLGSLAPTDDPNMLGRLGGYEVSGVIGAGGMGVVLKALDRSLDRTIAIKVMAPHLASSGPARRRFAREAKAAAAVLHPNVVAIHGVSDGDGSGSLPFLVMPYVRGTSLQTRIDRDGPMEVAEILRVASQIVEGLAAAHAQGLVHRDIKPANILLEESVERVSITDFGLARAVDDATLTHSGVLAGTPQYMSPEQARGDAIDGRSDLFSLGSVMYAMCTGRAPFRAETPYGILRRITDQPARPIREINSEIPVWLCNLIDKLHAKSAEDRYQSADAVAGVLQQCLAHVQTPNASLPSELLRPTSGKPLTLKLLACLGVAVTIWLVWFSFGNLAGTKSEQDQEVKAATDNLFGQGSQQENSSDSAAGAVIDPQDEMNVGWEAKPEPSIESIQVLIDSLEKDTRRSFDWGPNSEQATPLLDD